MRETQKALPKRVKRAGSDIAEDYAERGFRSHVKGSIDIDLDQHIDRRVRSAASVVGSSLSSV